jgi:hypothetical protein
MNSEKEPSPDGFSMGMFYDFHASSSLKKVSMPLS